MLTNKQEQGFKILNTIVVSEFPFIKKIEPVKEDLFKWAFSFDVILHIDVKKLSKNLGIELSEKFKYMDDKTLKMKIDDWNSWNFSYVYHFFDKSFEEELGNNFNRKISDFMSTAYKQLPKDFRINIYENHLSKDDPFVIRTANFNDPKTIDISKMIFYAD